MISRIRPVTSCVSLHAPCALTSSSASRTSASTASTRAMSSLSSTSSKSEKPFPRRSSACTVMSAFFARQVQIHHPFGDLVRIDRIIAAGDRRLDLGHAVHVDGRAFGRHAGCRALRIADLRSSAIKADGRSRLTFSRFPQLPAIKPHCPCLTYGFYHDIFPFPVPLTAYKIGRAHV